MEHFFWLLSWLSTSVATEFFWCSISKASGLQLVLVITCNLYTLIKSESLLMKWWFFIISLHLRLTAQYLFDACYCFVALARLTLAKSPCLLSAVAKSPVALQIALWLFTWKLVLWLSPLWAGGCLPPFWPWVEVGKWEVSSSRMCQVRED